MWHNPVILLHRDLHENMKGGQKSALFSIVCYGLLKIICKSTSKPPKNIDHQTLKITKFHQFLVVSLNTFTIPKKLTTVPSKIFHSCEKITNNLHAEIKYNDSATNSQKLKREKVEYARVKDSRTENKLKHEIIL